MTIDQQQSEIQHLVQHNLQLFIPELFPTMSSQNKTRQLEMGFKLVIS